MNLLADDFSIFLPKIKGWVVVDIPKIYVKQNLLNIDIYKVMHVYRLLAEVSEGDHIQSRE